MRTEACAARQALTLTVPLPLNPTPTQTQTQTLTQTQTQTLTQTLTLTLTLTLSRRNPRPNGRCTLMVAGQCMRCWPGALPALARPRGAGADGNSLRDFAFTADSRPWTARASVDNIR